MFGSTQLGANAYANIGVETGVAAVSPHKLITMLFDGALIAISMGEKYMKAGDIKKKGESITQAILIIEGGLRTSLDKSAGGEIASNLDALYEYMGRRLLVANVENSTSILKEVHDLLDDLRDAWRTIGLDGADR
ncbi:MAG: flagellar export chaperone FliS [Herbaspirillum sp.]